jgi:hypothetical protein
LDHFFLGAAGVYTARYILSSKSGCDSFTSHPPRGTNRESGFYIPYPSQLGGEGVIEMTKTREELEALKQNWLKDPCWDIEDTPGFEAHVDELLAFRKEQELEWQREEEDRIARRARVVAIETGITDSDIQQNILTFREIENTVQEACKRTESDSDVLTASQVRATLLLAAQVARVAHVMELIEQDLVHDDMEISMEKFSKDSLDQINEAMKRAM